jgi:hypothetical protein
LFEELFYHPDAVRPTAHPKVFASSLLLGDAKANDTPALLKESLKESSPVSELLHQMVPEYRETEKQ